MLIAEALYNPQAIPLAMVLAFAVSMYPLGFMLGSSCSPCCGCKGILQDVPCVRVTISNSHAGSEVCEECSELNGTYTLTPAPYSAAIGFCVYLWETKNDCTVRNQKILPKLDMRLIFNQIDSKLTATFAVSGYINNTTGYPKALLLVYDIEIVSLNPLVLSGSSTNVCTGAAGSNADSAYGVEAFLKQYEADHRTGPPLQIDQPPCSRAHNWLCESDISIAPADTPCQVETWDHISVNANPFTLNGLTQCTMSFVSGQGQANPYLFVGSSIVFDIISESSSGCLNWRFSRTCAEVGLTLVSASSPNWAPLFFCASGYWQPTSSDCVIPGRVEYGARRLYPCLAYPTTYPNSGQGVEGGLRGYVSLTPGWNFSEKTVAPSLDLGLYYYCSHLPNSQCTPSWMKIPAERPLDFSTESTKCLGDPMNWRKEYEFLEIIKLPRDTFITPPFGDPGYSMIYNIKVEVTYS